MVRVVTQYIYTELKQVNTLRYLVEEEDAPCRVRAPSYYALGTLGSRWPETRKADLTES